VPTADFLKLLRNAARDVKLSVHLVLLRDGAYCGRRGSIVTTASIETTTCKRCLALYRRNTETRERLLKKYA
jgi:hypothetical protein